MDVTRISMAYVIDPSIAACLDSERLDLSLIPMNFDI